MALLRVHTLLHHVAMQSSGSIHGRRANGAAVFVCVGLGHDYSIGTRRSDLQSVSRQRPNIWHPVENSVHRKTRSSQANARTQGPAF